MGGKNGLALPTSMGLGIGAHDQFFRSSHHLTISVGKAMPLTPW